MRAPGTRAPRQPPLAVPAALAAVSAVLTLTSGFLLSRLKQFAWPRFFLAFRWALLAYLISAGMIGFAFTVARYSSPPYAPS